MKSVSIVFPRLMGQIIRTYSRINRLSTLVATRDRRDEDNADEDLDIALIFVEPAHWQSFQSGAKSSPKDRVIHVVSRATCICTN